MAPEMLQIDLGEAQKDSFAIKLSEIDIIPYDFAGFDDFYQRHQFRKNDNLDLDRPPQELQQLVISWLYLGLLSELLGRHITKSDVESSIIPDDNRHLGDLLCAYITRASQWHKKERDEFLDDSYNKLFCAATWCERFESSGITRASFLAHSTLAVRILISAFSTLLLEIHEDWKEPMSESAPPYLGQLARLMAKYKPLSSTDSMAKSARDPMRRKHDAYDRVINPKPLAYGPTGTTHTSKVLVNRMKKNNWCPHQIRQVLKSYDYSICNYLSQLVRPHERSHRACSGTNRCVADNAPAASQYLTKHTSQDCACTHISAPIDPITKIIAKGKIPLISLVETKNGDIKIMVCERTTCSRYVAISHVWADGFGNPSANSLPYCTLNKLKSWLQHLPLPKYEVGVTLAGTRFDASRFDFIKQTPWFWMDTLCVPVEERFSNLRTSHINDMASIYAGSSQVLVLDAELLNISIAGSLSKGQVSNHSIATEVLSRIAFCTWARRSWTFQEGALGPETVFQLEDVAVDITTQWSSRGPRHPLFTGSFRFPQATDPLDCYVFKSMYQRVWHILQRTYGSIENEQLDHCQKPFPDPGRTFGNIGLISKSANFRELRHHGELLVRCWNEVSLRSTTMAEDIHLIMANLLDFDADSIMKLPRLQRMIVMMRSIQTLPLSLMFAGKADPADKAGFYCTWLPSEPNGELTPNHYMNLTRRGLVTPASSDEFVTMLLPAGMTGRYTVLNRKLQILLDISAPHGPHDPHYRQSMDRKLLMLPTRLLSSLTWNAKSIRLQGAYLSISGYCKDETVHMERLHVSYCGLIDVKATALVEGDQAGGRRLPKWKRQNTLVERWPPVEVENIPDDTSLLLLCDLATRPKLPRRCVSTSHLSRILLKGYTSFRSSYLVSFSLMTLIYTIYASVSGDPVLRDTPRPQVWIPFVVIFGVLSTALAISCAALAHQERCALLESFNYGRKPEKSSGKWTGWITNAVRLWYQKTPKFGRYGYGPWFWKYLFTWTISKVRKSLMAANFDDANPNRPSVKWDWAEDQGILGLDIEQDEE
ncbi:hypothetical protein BS50DRAFT_619323 [Corynespora cassiicola Philippines]|uniref:Heterokaryon incompatibility domain-containing protein n=1 Tax=Corynespora cassiicola Philippines TaxID=1448308 RepID=A0A2T2NYZ9_CORCC|nr:hypothetical protein BS50DRAFT_619323 [Corynespora cassiicola Philippines]